MSQKISKTVLIFWFSFLMIIFGAATNVNASDICGATCCWGDGDCSGLDSCFSRSCGTSGQGSCCYTVADPTPTPIPTNTPVPTNTPAPGQATCSENRCFGNDCRTVTEASTCSPNTNCDCYGIGQCGNDDECTPDSTPTPTSTPTNIPTPCPRPSIPGLNSPAANATFLTGSNITFQLNSVTASCGSNTAIEYLIPFNFNGVTYTGNWQSGTSRLTGPYAAAGTGNWYGQARIYDSYYSTYRTSFQNGPRAFSVVTPTAAATATPTATSTPTPTACPRPPMPNLNSPAANASFLTGSYINFVIDSVTAVCGSNTTIEYLIPFNFNGVDYTGSWQSGLSRYTGPYNNPGTGNWYGQARIYDSYYSTYRTSFQNGPRAFSVVTPAPGATSTPTPTNTPTATPTQVVSAPNLTVPSASACYYEPAQIGNPYSGHYGVVGQFSVRNSGNLIASGSFENRINTLQGSWVTEPTRVYPLDSLASGATSTFSFQIDYGPWEVIIPTLVNWNNLTAIRFFADSEYSVVESNELDNTYTLSKLSIPQCVSPTATPPGAPSPTPTFTPTLTPTPVPGNIIGRIFIDTNEDGARQAGETIIDSGSDPDVLIWYREGVSSWQGAGSTTHCTGNPGDYQASSIPPGTYQVRMALNTADWVFTRSGTGSYAVSPGSGICSWSGGSGTSTNCEAGSGDECTQIIIDGIVISEAQTRYIWAGVKQADQPWFQIQGGGAHLDSGATVSVPSGQYFVVANSDSAEGVVSNSSGSISLGGGSLSSTGWQVGDQQYQGPVYQVGYFSRRFENSEREVTLIDIDEQTSLSQVTALNCSAPGSTCQIGADQTIVVRRSDGSELSIDRDVSIASGGFFGVMVDGDVAISGDVDSLDGLYLANGNLTVSDGASQLVFNGIVVADADFTGSEGVVVNRAISGSDPSVIFNYDPNLVFKMPRELWKKQFKYQHLLP